MLNRFLSLLGKSTSPKDEEQEPLLDSEAVAQHPTDDFVRFPNETLAHIVSYLKPEDMAHFAQTNKRHRTITNNTTTTIDVLAKNTETQVSTVRKATYAELAKILSQRKPLWRNIKKVQPNALVNYVGEHKYVLSVVCTGGLLFTGGSSVTTSFLLSSAATGCTPTTMGLGFVGLGCISSSAAAQPVIESVSEWRERKQSQVDELREELNAMPTVMTMTK